MALIAFDLRSYNVFEVGGRTYFVAETGPGRVVVLPDACPHRGGPLRLGEYDAEGCVLICPWHRTRVRVDRLVRRALPAARRGNRITAYAPDDPGTPVSLGWRTGTLRTLY